MTSVRNIWGGSFEIVPTAPTTVDGTGKSDRGACQSPNDDEVKQSWLLRAEEETGRKRRKGISCVNCCTILRSLLVAIVLAGLIVLVVTLSKRHRHRRPPPVPDNYTVALHKALMFFNAQRSGKLPKQNNVSWRGNSCLQDEISGGYYDGGSAVKYTFPASFAMTILSWSVIEYSSKYEAAGELDHVKATIKWGTDYLLKTFNSSHASIATTVGSDRDHDCWMRPEDIDYPRPATQCHNCPAVAAETAAALAAASIVFKDNREYSKKLVDGAEMVFKFATKDQGVGYSGGPDPPSVFYNSSGYWDEFLWSGAWLYLATGNMTYLKFVTSPDLASKDRDFFAGSSRGVVSWDNKHAAAQLLLTRVRIFLGYGYPYEEMLRTYQTNVETIMCSYLPVFPTFKRTPGGLIQLNKGRPRPLQYVVNAAFMVILYSDYLESNLISGWPCGARFYRIEELRDFALGQVDYILGKNPERMSYIVGFGDKFPRQVHHRGASIPNNGVKYGCREGFKWRDSRQWNPNTIDGAMVGGPDSSDRFKDVRSDYNYTEATVAVNAGLVAALVGLSGERSCGIDKNTMFYAIPPMFRAGPPPPAPWKP